jgi:enoyl-[acyl-carrier protein] reductase I
VGNSAAFLLSDLAAGVTAEILHVDSGFNAVVGGMAVVAE